MKILIKLATVVNTSLIVNQKGGVAKTTTAFNIADNLVKNGNKVLLIDLDSQASLSLACGIKDTENYCTIADLLYDEISENKYIAVGSILTLKDNLDLLPSCIRLAGVENQVMNVMMRREHILDRVIDNIKIEKHYDYIIIDCLPSLGIYTINALSTSNYVLIPTNPSFLSFSGSTELLKTITQVKKYLNPDLKILGYVFTMVDIRSKYVKKILEEKKRYRI